MYGTACCLAKDVIAWQRVKAGDAMVREMGLTLRPFKIFLNFGEILMEVVAQLISNLQFSR